MSQPTVVVTDNNEAMPLNLARTGFSTYDTELIDALRTSIMEEYVGDAFLQSAESPTQMIEAVEPPERLVSIGSWNKFIYNTNGYCLFDFGIIRAADVDTVIVVHAGFDADFLRSALLKNDVVAVRNTNFPGSNKREVIDHIRLGKDHWPVPPFMYHAGQNYLTTRANWIGHHAILLSLAKTALRARNLPRYVEKTIQNGPVVKTSNGDYLIFATGDTHVGEYSHLEELLEVMTASKAPAEAKRAITVWKMKDKSDLKSIRQNIVARIWHDSFITSLLPFDAGKRDTVLKGDAPILRFLKAKSSP